MKDPRKKYLRPDEVADRLDVSLDTIYRLLREGKIRGYRIRRVLRIKEDELKAYLAQHPANGTPPKPT